MEAKASSSRRYCIGPCEGSFSPSQGFNACRAPFGRTALFAAAALLLVAGCAGPDKRQAAEKARLEAQRQAALQQLDGLHAPKNAPAEIPGLSTSSADQIVSRPRPEWAGDGVPASYPASLYLTGVGSAERGNGSAYKALAAAEDRARAELAKGVRVRIQAEFQNAARLVTESSTGQAAVVQDRNETADRIRSQADVELEGVHIVDRWYDQKGGAYWTLAALERSTAGRRILDQMEMVRRQSGIDAELGRKCADEGQKVQAAACFARSAQAAYTVLNLRAQLNAIAPDLLGRQPPESMPITALLKDAAVALGKLTVKMTVFADAEDASVTAADAETMIAAALRKEGLNVVRLPAPPGARYDDLVDKPVAALREWAGGETDILLLARVRAEHVDSKQMNNLTMHFYRARGSAVAVNLDAGRMLTSASFDLLDKSHSANADRRRAAEAALHEAAAELSSRLRAGFIEAFGVMK